MKLKQPANILEAKEVEGYEAPAMTISCMVEGNPLPEILWKDKDLNTLASTKKLDFTKFKTNELIRLDGDGNLLQGLTESVDQLNSQVTKLSENSLKLEVTFKDRNLHVPNNFRCEASNVHGDDFGEIEIESENYIKYADEDEGEVFLSSELGETIDLNCNIEGNPKPEYLWRFVS